MKKIIVLLILYAVSACQILSADELMFKNNSVLYVFSISGLNMRDEPSTSSKVLEMVPYGSKITVLDTVSKIQAIDNYRGYFIKAAYNGRTGYLFDGFLSSLPAPDLKKNECLDTYASKYLGSGIKQSDRITVYTGGIIHENLSSEGYYGSRLTVTGIRPGEGFLLLRALAISMDIGFTGKEPLPVRNASYEEKHNGVILHVEIKFEKRNNSTVYEINKTHPDGHIFSLFLEQSGKRIVMTAGTAD